VVAAFFCVFYVGGAFAIISGPPASPSNFEAGDGNMTNDTVGNADWNCFANGKSSGFPASGVTVGSTCSSNLVYANAKQVTADGNGEISWVNGQKFDTACPSLSVNNNPPKDEFTHVASYNDTDPTTKDLFLYGATVRPNTNGNSTGNVELDQKAGNGTTTAGCRTAGDRLIAYDFLNGGTSLNFHVLTWITNLNHNLGGNSSDTCFVKTDTDAFNTTTQSGGCWGANVISETSNDLSTFEGGVNTGVGPNVGTIDAAHNGLSGGTGGESVPALAFAEFGINASKAFGTEGQCTSFAQLQWESRSSGSSFTSNPQDIETESANVSNCGEVKIIKHTDPRGTNKSFSYTSDMSGSPTCSQGAGTAVAFSLNDNGNTSTSGESAANTQDCTNVSAGTVHVTETEPSGWVLESLTCSTGGAQDGTNPLKADITVPAGGTVTCTYVNKQNTAQLSTQVSNAGPVTPGTSVNDQASVVGSNSSLTPSGSVTFYLCGPSQTTLTSCSSSDKTQTQVGSPDGLSGSAGTATVNSDNLNTSSSPLQPGNYCFGATWPGDTNYPGALSDNGTNECFSVAQIPTSTVTTPNDGSGVPGAESTITLGSTIYDTAVVSGTSVGGAPTGSVDFHWCSGSCSSGGTDLGSASVSQVGTTYTSSATSAGFSPTATGTYCFRGDYLGSTVYKTSSDSSSTECFTVTDTTSSSSAQSWYPNDSASVSANHGAKLNGTLSVQLYSNADCGVAEAGAGAVNNSAVNAANNNAALTNAASGTVSTSNTSYHVDASGSYSWLVTFTSTDSNVGSSSHCETATLSINNNP
jgi:hypothetical protein